MAGFAFIYMDGFCYCSLMKGALFEFVDVSRTEQGGEACERMNKLTLVRALLACATARAGGGGGL